MNTELPVAVLHDLEFGTALVHYPYRRLRICEQISVIEGMRFLDNGEAAKKISKIHELFAKQTNTEVDNHQGFCVKSKGRLLFALFSDGFIYVGLSHVIRIDV
jgi:hypothetical protein